MAVATVKAERGRDKKKTRRDLVRIETVEGTDRPLHIFAAASGELIAKLKADANLDFFLDSLSEEAFY